MRLIILVVVFLHGIGAYSQTVDDSRRSMLSFQIGAHHVRTINEGMSSSRLLTSGTFVPLYIQYMRETPQHLTRVSFHYAGGNLTHDEVSTHLDIGTLHAEHLRTIRKVAFLSKQHLLTAGLRAGISVFYFASPQLDNEDIFVLNALHVRFADKIVLTASKTLEIQLSIPTIGLSKRLTLEGGLYEPRAEEQEIFDLIFNDSQVVFANSYELRTGYKQLLSKGITWDVDYQFFYIGSNLKSSLRLYSNSLRTGFTFYL
jgi:hypothetical protein